MASEQDQRPRDLLSIPDKLPEEQSKTAREDSALCGSQPWTLSGSPIVDGRYCDFNTRTLQKIQPGESVRSGPPAIDVYWHNLCLTGGPTHFFGFRASYTAGDAASYVAKLGDFFSKMGGGACELHSLNVTTYSVVVFVVTERSKAEISEHLVTCGLR